MDSQFDITPKDFFSNAAAREAGFTEEFWYQAYRLYLGEAERDPNPSWGKFDIPRTVRMPFNQGYVDVIARVQPEPRDYRIVRLTAFPADGGDGPDGHQMSRWYHRDESGPRWEKEPCWTKTRDGSLCRRRAPRPGSASWKRRTADCAAGERSA